MDQIEMEHITSPYDILEEMRNAVMWLPPPSCVCNFPRNKEMEEYLYLHKIPCKNVNKFGLKKSYLKPVDLFMRSQNGKKYFLTYYTLNGKAVAVTLTNGYFEKLPSELLSCFFNYELISISECIFYGQYILGI